MTRWSKIQAVTSFEFLTMVKRKGYLITTFGMPVIMLAYGALIGGIGLMIDDNEDELRIVGVIDQSGLVQLAGDQEVSPIDLPENIRKSLDSMADWSPSGAGLESVLGNTVFRPFGDEDEARKAVVDKKIRGFFVIPEDYLASGKVREFTGENVSLTKGSSRSELRRLLLAQLIRDRLPEELAKRVRTPITRTESFSVTETGEIEGSSKGAKIIGQILVPMVFAILFLISMMMTAGYLVQGTALEKENKVVEVLLSSANPDEVLTGKLLGLGGAGLLQIAVWFGMMGVAGLLFAAALTKFGVAVPWVAILVGLAFFVAGYLFLGSLMLGAGSLGSNIRESQQYTMVWTLLTVAPLMMLGVLIQNPHSTLGIVMTWIPFTAPLTVILRLTLDAEGIAWWEVLGSWLVLVASTWFALRFGARLFRVGLLLTGSRPKLREIIRQARLS